MGSGAAGLRAAIEAKRNKSDVLIASKSEIGYNSCSLYSEGAFSAPIEGLTPQRYFELTLETGRGINNQQLLRVLAEEAARRMLELRDFGVRLRVWRGGGSFSDTSVSPLTSGFGIVKPLRDAAEKLGVRFLPKTFISKILVMERRVFGVAGFNLDGDFVVISARSVVLACGGAGQIYLRNDNPSGITGDGYALALDAGVPLVDMEFVQFFPVGSDEEELPLYMIPLVRSKYPEICEMGTLVNAKGVDLLGRYFQGGKLHRVSSKARDELSRVLLKELGDTGGVFLDLRRIPEALWEESEPLKIFKRYWLRGLRRDVLRVLPLTHHFMGGAEINERCETAVEGLYVCGENAGGVHGANRMGGNALTDAVVFGAIAGQGAAQRARETTGERIGGDVVDEERQRLLGFLRQDRGVKARDVKEEVQRLAWTSVGIIRSGRSLNEALERIAEIRALEDFVAEDARQLMRVLEALNMIRVAETVAKSALTRDESRGAHFREDHPDQMAEWVKNVVVEPRDGELKTRVKPASKL
ncbi:MAG: FAD-binding protein [Candidatus Geothermarchaeales archaeon]